MPCSRPISAGWMVSRTSRLETDWRRSIAGTTGWHGLLCNKTDSWWRWPKPNNGTAPIALPSSWEPARPEFSKRNMPMRNGIPDRQAWRRFHGTLSIHTQHVFVRHFVRACLGLHGPALVISTACSSSAKVFATAARYLQAGLCDAAIVGVWTASV